MLIATVDDANPVSINLDGPLILLPYINQKILLMQICIHICVPIYICTFRKALTYTVHGPDTATSTLSKEHTQPSRAARDAWQKNAAIAAADPERPHLGTERPQKRKDPHSDTMAYMMILYSMVWYSIVWYSIAE